MAADKSELLPCPVDDFEGESRRASTRTLAEA
jgi:hypothetical protein